MSKQELKHTSLDNDLAKVREEGFKEGNRIGHSEGLSKGRLEGIGIGLKEGRKEGRIKERVKIARKLLHKSKDIEFTMEITGLSFEQIKQIILKK